ncbi:MAG: ketoacyl-ACP synthase III, partial [Deltaproteobacteria bacterium]|nr:ketoacyl-ACP synthase III [Deltaproteobacteria bacterium]
LDVAARSVATGLEPVGVVSVERLSRFLTAEDPRPYMVLADAAGAAVLGPAEPKEGILALSMGNDGSHKGAVFMAHPGLSDRTETIVFNESNRGITDTALDALERCAKRALDECGLGVPDINWAVVHQPNGSMTRKILKRLNIPVDRVIPVAQDIGSTGSASIAVGLDRLWHSGRVQPGHRILIVGVGAGMSYGAMVYQVGS